MKTGREREREEREGKVRGILLKGKREVKEKRIGREGKGENELKLKNGRLGKEIELVATLYNP